MTDKILHIVRENVNQFVSIDDDTQLEALDIDDLHLVTIALALEDEFDIEISSDEYESWETVGDIRLTVSALLDIDA